MMHDVAFRLFGTLGPALRPLLGIAAVLGVAGLVFLATKFRHARLVGRSLLLLGSVLAWVGLLAVSEYQIERRESSMITTRASAYPDPTRNMAKFGLFAIPVVWILITRLEKRLMTDWRKNRLSTYLRDGMKAFFAGDYDQAIAQYSIAIKAAPSRTEAYEKRGAAYMQKGEYELAIGYFNKALAIDQSDATAYLHRGMVFAAQGDHARAIEDFDRSFTNGPSNAEPLLHRGLSHAKLGEVERAREDFERVLKVTNHSDFTEPARFHLGLLPATTEPTASI